MPAETRRLFKQILSKPGPGHFSPLGRAGRRWLLVSCLWIGAALACVTNTPVAQIATPRPTRTSLPTFTITPIPPTPTPVPSDTITPTPTETPPVTNTPTPTDTPLSPTDTPIPTDTPVPPTNTPPPPPATPTPTPPPPATPTPVAVSPLATPTPTPQPDTPPGRYEALNTEKLHNCYDIGVTGRAIQKGSEAPVQYATIQVTGDDDDYKGPFIGKSDADGKYNIYIGPKDDVGQVEFTAVVVGGAGVKSEDKVEWKTSKDCKADGTVQVMRIIWARKN